MTTRSIAWNDQQITTLRQLWADGLSASQIGEQLGCTRNAIMGKIYRLGLAREHPIARADGRPPLSSAPRNSRGSKASEPHTARAARLVNRRAQVIKSALPILQLPDEHLPGNKTILELGLRDCRWPIGDQRTPATLFCGAQALSGKPYCDEHCRIGGATYRVR